MRFQIWKCFSYWNFWKFRRICPWV